MSTRTDVADNLELHEALAKQVDRLGASIAALRTAEMCLRRALENSQEPEAFLRNVTRAWAICNEAIE